VNKTSNRFFDFVGILVDIHRLNEYIAQGDANKAANAVAQLTSQGVPVQAKISARLPNEKMFPYVQNNSFSFL
jgi:hypothetical protein